MSINPISEDQFLKFFAQFGEFHKRLTMNFEMTRDLDHCVSHLVEAAMWFRMNYEMSQKSELTGEIKETYTDRENGKSHVVTHRIDSGQPLETSAKRGNGRDVHEPGEKERTSEGFEVEN